MSFVKTTVSAVAMATLAASAATARDNVQVAGSSTVVEPGGSSGGLKRFCEGVGENTIDVANASRKIKDTEITACAEAGVTDIIEVRIGYDGIVFASDIYGQNFAFQPADIYTALAAELPVDGKMVANPNTDWSAVNANFKSQPIQAYIPGTKHGTREVFEEKVLLAGCEETGAMAAILEINGGDEDAAESACMAVRTDGRSVDIDGDYTETLASIESNKDGIGVFGLAFYENNTDKLQVATMSGVMPSTASIAAGEYPVSRPLFFYIKKAHIGVIPGLKEYAEFFISDEVAGPDGPLAEYGLVSDPELAATQAAVSAEETLK